MEKKIINDDKASGAVNGSGADLRCLYLDPYKSICKIIDLPHSFNEFSKILDVPFLDSTLFIIDNNYFISIVDDQGLLVDNPEYSVVISPQRLLAGQLLIFGYDPLLTDIRSLNDDECLLLRRWLMPYNGHFVVVCPDLFSC